MNILQIEIALKFSLGTGLPGVMEGVWGWGGGALRPEQKHSYRSKFHWSISVPMFHMCRRACQAVKHLSEFHGLKKRGLVPSSLFLDQLLQNAGKFSETTSRHWYLRRDKLCEYYYKKVS